MKKFGLVILALLILGLATMAIMVFGDHLVLPGVSDVLRDKVIGVALADPKVQGFINASDKLSGPEYIRPGDSTSFIKDNARYAGVSFSGNSGGEPISLLVIVDTYTMNESGISYSGVPPLLDSWIIIPPGNAIASEMTESYGMTSPMKYFVPEISSGGLKMEISPEGARLSPIIVDQNNYNRYLNGSAYDVPELIDPATSNRVKVNGSEIVTSGWSGNYILPPEIQSYRVGSDFTARYYLILENRETDREIKITYRYPFSAILG